MPEINLEGLDNPAQLAAKAKALQSKLNTMSRTEAREERDKLELERRDLASEYHDRLGPESHPSDEDHAWGRETQVKIDGLDHDIKDINAALSLQATMFNKRDPKKANQKRAMLAYAAPHQAGSLLEAEKDGKVMSAEEVEDLSEGEIAAIRAFPVNGGSIIVHGRVGEDFLNEVPGGTNIRAADVSNAQTSIGDHLPTGATGTILERLVQYGDLGDLPSKMSTPNGNKIIAPSVDDSSQKGRRMGKTGRSQTPTDPTFAEIELDAWLYTSDPVQVRQDSLTDAPYGLGMLMEHLMATRIARIQGEEMTTGTGSDQPQGVVTIADVALTLGDGQTPSRVAEFTSGDISDLIQKLDPAYKRAGMMSQFTPNMGRIGFLIAHGAEGVLRKMKDDDNRPLWLPNIREKDPMTIYGYPYHVNTAMDDPAAGKTSVLFGHFGYYMVRTVDGIVVRRWDDSQYGKDFRVAFQAFARCDARGIGGWAGTTTTATKAILAMKQSAT